MLQVHLNGVGVDPVQEGGCTSENRWPGSFATESKSEADDTDVHAFSASLDGEWATAVTGAGAAAVGSGHANIRGLDDAGESDGAESVGHDVVVDESENIGGLSDRIVEDSPSRNDTKFTREVSCV